jgi:CubicO group peptidase (beta-lactamase class C family)
MDAEQLYKTICELIHDAMKKHQVPGVAFGVVADGREFSAGFGVTNVHHPLAVDDTTLFQIGSITKTYTATALARLAEMGRIRFDAPVRDYLPEFKMRDFEATERATIRHLLVHTAGWQGDFFEDTGSGDDALKVYVAKMADLPQVAPLGKIWSYNNSAFSVAGRVIEVVTGKTYETALSELVLAPLQLSQTFIFPADVMTHRFAVGHATPVDPDSLPGVLRPWALPRSVWAAGGLTASIKDVLRYARFHLGDGTNAHGAKVMTRESLVEMQTPGVPGEFDEKMGLAWRIREPHGTRIAFHMGGTLGQISLLTLDPSCNFAFSFLTNSAMGALVMADVTRETFPLFTGFRDEPPSHLAMTTVQLQEYVGRYTATLTDVELDLANEGHLVAQLTPKGGFPTRDSPPGPTPPPTRVEFIGADLIVTMDPPFSGLQGQFLRDDSGRVGWLRIHGRIHRCL